MAKLNKLDYTEFVDILEKVDLETVEDEFVDNMYLAGMSISAKRLGIDLEVPKGRTHYRELPSGNPTIHALSHALIESLRCRLYAENDVTGAKGWIEKLLRYCEVNVWRLRKVLRKKYGQRAHCLLVNLAALFADAYLVTNDLRYLNILLKLSRMPLVADYHLVPFMFHHGRDSRLISLCVLKIWAVILSSLKDLREN